MLKNKKTPYKTLTEKRTIERRDIFRKGYNPKTFI